MSGVLRSVSKHLIAPTTSEMLEVPTPQYTPTRQPTLNPAFKVRPMNLQELKTVFVWASNVSWYLSPQDAEVCYRSGPEGFFIGEIDGEPICSYLCYKFGDYYFLTINVVAEEHQGIGYGKKIQELTKFYYKNAKVVCFEAADEGIARYKRLGYTDLCGMITYKKTAKGSIGPNAVDLQDIPIQELIDYDLKVFGYPRDKFLRSCVEEKSYKNIGIKKGGKLKGFGTLRKSHKKGAYVLAGVTAEDKETAREILESLQSFVVGEDVYIEVLDLNSNAIELVKEQNWEYLFDCRRMYGGEMPKTDFSRTYTEYGL